jgi:hypothetical protein
MFEHLLIDTSQRCVCADPLTAATAGGLLADIYDCNDRIRQQVSALSSQDFQADLIYAEVTAVAPAAGGDIERRPDSQGFKEALRDCAIEMSGAKAVTDVVFVKWRSQATAADGVSRATTFNVGFNSAELHAEFVRRAKLLDQTALGGFRITEAALTVFSVPSARGFRFFVPIPAGWSDEQLCEAMVMQGGLDPDHLLSFGADLAKNHTVAAPSGDLFFNYAPAGCMNHGSVTLVPILQPPSRMFVLHPVSGVEHHLQVRKAGACRHCWDTPGRHQSSCIYSGICRMCLEAYADMPAEGKRHACGQGHLSKPRGRSTVFTGEVPSEAPPPSPLAARLRAMQQANIISAKAKRAREPEAEAPAAPEENSAQANKAPRNAGKASPSAPASPSPADDTPITVSEEAEAPAASEETPAQANKAPRNSGRASPSAPASPSPAEDTPVTVSKAIGRRRKGKEQ